MLDLTYLFSRSDRSIELAAGQTIFNAGEPGNQMYIVMSGRVDIIINGQVTESVEPGGIFGEMALIDSTARSGTAIAVTDCTLEPIDERRFLYLVQQNPFFALHVMSVMSERLRRKNVNN
jgi:CRP-like cAMP-binding protein